MRHAACTCCVIEHIVHGEKGRRESGRDSHLGSRGIRLSLGNARVIYYVCLRQSNQLGAASVDPIENEDAGMRSTRTEMLKGVAYSTRESCRRARGPRGARLRRAAAWSRRCGREKVRRGAFPVAGRVCCEFAPKRDVILSGSWKVYCINYVADFGLAPRYQSASQNAAKHTDG